MVTSKLTPKQIDEMKLALAIVKAQLVDDQKTVNSLFAAGGSDLQPVLDGMFGAGVALATLLAGLTNRSVKATLESLTPAEVSVFPGSSVNWAAGIQLLEAVRIGDAQMKEISAQMDIPSALHTALSVIVGLLWALDGVQGHDSDFWLQQTATWLLQGAPAAAAGWSPPTPL
jgi:hypothetical protein